MNKDLIGAILYKACVAHHTCTASCHLIRERCRTKPPRIMTVERTSSSFSSSAIIDDRTNYSSNCMDIYWESTDLLLLVLLYISP